MNQVRMPEGGFCDLHCHLLPGVDDGPKNFEDALEMARALVDLGFSVAAPSPHNRPEYATAGVALARLGELQAELEREAIALRLAPNSENFFLDETLLSVLRTPAARPIGAGPYLLVEAPYTAPLPPLLEIIFRMKLKGVTPLIAHPERCAEFERKGRATEAVRAGARLQLDLGALTNRYGPGARKLARTFLDEGLYAVAATDLHGAFAAREWVEKAIRELERRAGAIQLQQLLGTNPHRILRGEALEM